MFPVRFEKVYPLRNDDGRPGAGHIDFPAVICAPFGAWELWVIRHLVEPFERIARARLPEAGSAHRMLLEQPVTARQYNLDGYVFDGDLRELGIVESVMYPGTQCFMRFAHPCALPVCVRTRALDVAQRFFDAVRFTHGLFNMEFFYDEIQDRLTVIEFNPRMASQFSDLYLRVEATAGVAASFVYRSFDPSARPSMPSAAQQVELTRQFPDAMPFCFPKSAGQIARDFKWLVSYRYGILHLGGCDAADLAIRCAAASKLLGWPSPCSQHDADDDAVLLHATPTLSLETSR
jgi:hypothetical protein